MSDDLLLSEASLSGRLSASSATAGSSPCSIWANSSCVRFREGDGASCILGETSTRGIRNARTVLGPTDGCRTRTGSSSMTGQNVAEADIVFEARSYDCEVIQERFAGRQAVQLEGARMSIVARR